MAERRWAAVFRPLAALRAWLAPPQAEAGQLRPPWSLWLSQQRPSQQQFWPPTGWGIGLLVAWGWGPAALLLRNSAVLAEEGSLYDLLGVSRNASEQDIKKAYKKSALKNHPDKAPEGEREAYEERFKRVARAYEILSDPEKRQIYNAHGEAAFDGRDASGAGPAGGGFPGGFGAGFSGSDPYDIFRQFFGGQDMFGHGHGFGGRRRTQDVGYAMEVSLEEIYSGCTRPVRYSQDVVCTACGGQGASRVEICATCRGAGATVTTRQMGGYYTQVQSTCQVCRGAGRTVPPGAICNSCRGQGMMQRQVNLDVKVPPGCPNRHRVVFRGKADEAPGAATGDVIVEVCEKKHPTFKRLGDADLLVDKRVSLLDALCGVRFRIKHLDGEAVEVDCSTGGQVVRPGDIWVVKGRGMPRGSRLGHGDLLVRFEVDFPKELSSASQDKVREQLRPLIDPRASAGDSQSTGSKQGGGSGWFWRSSGGDSASKAKAETASRLPEQRIKQVAQLVEAQEREKHEREDGHSSTECRQM